MLGTQRVRCNNVNHEFPNSKTNSSLQLKPEQTPNLRTFAPRNMAKIPGLWASRRTLGVAASHAKGTEQADMNQPPEGVETNPRAGDGELPFSHFSWVTTFPPSVLFSLLLRPSKLWLAGHKMGPKQESTCLGLKASNVNCVTGSQFHIVYQTGTQWSLPVQRRQYTPKEGSGFQRLFTNCL